MAKYHPRGDSSIYDTMVRLAQDFNMRVPLVEGNGNFGSMDGDTAAAFRYTEARMAPAALLMMRDPRKGAPIGRMSSQNVMGLYLNDEVKWLNDEWQNNKGMQ